MEKKNIEEEKQIPLKNYIYVIVMFILVMLAVLGLSTWYRNYKKYEFSTPVISGKVQEISKNEFKEYVNSHDNFYLYIGTADNKACRDLEMNLVDLLNKYNVKNDTVYLNASNASKDEITELLKEYGYNIDYLTNDLHSDKDNIITTEYEDKFTNKGIKINYFEATKEVK